MKIISILILIASAALNVAVNAQDYFDDPYLYYRVGGARSVAQPATTQPIQFSSNSALSGFSCGSFNPLQDIRSMLGGIGDSLVDLQSLPTQMLSAMPGQILCRAQPSLCQLTQHYSVRAEDAWRFSVGSCEDALATGGLANSEWMKYGQAQEWQRQAAAGATADEAYRAVSQTEDPCVTWVEGKRAGCPGNPAIRPVRDTVTAGWCVVNDQPADCSSGGADTYATKNWETPQDAASFAADIVGDIEINDGGTPRTHTPLGLQAMVEAETEKVTEVLLVVVANPGYGTAQTTEQLASPAVQVSTELINALRQVDENSIYAHRIAEEIALARVLDKALLARRLLIKGLMEPNIQASDTAKIAVAEAIERLDAEIDRLIFEFQTRRAIVADTSVELLQAAARARSPSTQPFQHFPHRLPN